MSKLHEIIGIASFRYLEYVTTYVTRFQAPEAELSARLLNLHILKNIFKKLRKIDQNSPQESKGHETIGVSPLIYL